MTERKFKQASTTLDSIADRGTVEGTLEGFSSMDVKNKETNKLEERGLITLKSEDGIKTSYWRDAGLENTIEKCDPQIKEGMYLRIEHTGKKPLEGGRSVNQYNIFVAE